MAIPTQTSRRCGRDSALELADTGPRETAVLRNIFSLFFFIHSVKIPRWRYSYHPNGCVRFIQRDEWNECMSFHMNQALSQKTSTRRSFWFNVFLANDSFYFRSNWCQNLRDCSSALESWIDRVGLETQTDPGYRIYLLSSQTVFHWGAPEQKIRALLARLMLAWISCSRT